MVQDSRIKRLRKLQATMQAAEIDAAVIILSRDVFYYTGTAQPCILLVTAARFFLVVRRAWDFVVRETFIEEHQIIDGGGFKEILHILGEIGIRKGTLAVEKDIIPAALYMKIQACFTGFSISDISPLILSQRMIKDESEIKLIRQACRIMDIGHKRTLAEVCPGMTELDLAAEIEYAHRRAGHDGVLSMRNFDFYISRGPLSAGQNLFRVSGFANTVTGVGLSAAVPAGPSYSSINIGDIIITDIPTCYKGYHCDQTRTYFLGEPPTRVKDLFGKLRQISDRTIQAIHPGVSCKSVFETACRSAKRLGVSQYFLGLPPRRAGFVGHGIGLDANEPPILLQHSGFIIKENMVLTVELHLSHPETGVVKLEDMIHVTRNGSRILSLTPRELFIIH